MPAPVDFYASLRHYGDHLAPIWAEIPEGERGTFWTQPRTEEHLRQLGIVPKPGRPRRTKRLVAVAGASDAWIVGGMPAALVEHGAGQAYDVPDPGWSGGLKRDSVVLFLCPNEVSAERNRLAYPDAQVEVVGSPRLEALRSAVGTSPDRRGERTGRTPTRERRPNGPPAVALSFHWPGNGRVAEAGWALPHYEERMGWVVAQLEDAGWEVLGHGHPRARNHFARMWQRLGVEHLERFDEVVARADVYACDNSSTMYEAAALGIPIVVLNAPWYRRDVDLWPRFWACADVGIHVEHPDELPKAVVAALEDPPAVAQARARAAAEVFPLIEGSARRATDALVRAAAALQ